MRLPGILVCALVALAGPVAAASRTAVPAEFVHDQVWVTPALGGVRLRLFTDTGGGWNAISDSLATRLQPAREPSTAGELVAWPAFDEGSGIPAAPPHFQTNDAGGRTMHFPSIDVEVDGEVLPMLIDSGATATTTELSAPLFGVAPGTNVGTSFIEHAVFERWTQAHPDWRVVEEADLKGTQKRRMIEVPVITVAGHSVGPVWFAEQPQGAFQSYMASMMDRPTWGALGGPALKHFRVVIDYPGCAAYFYR